MLRPTWPAINESITSANTLISALVLTAEDLLVVILSKYFVAKSGTNVPRRHRLASNGPEKGPEEPPGVLLRYFHYAAAWLETQNV